MYTNSGNRGCFFLTLFHPGGGGGGADLPPTHANAYTHKKSMGGNSDSELFYIPKCILGTLGTICHGKKTEDH